MSDPKIWRLDDKVGQKRPAFNVAVSLYSNLCFSSFYGKYCKCQLKNVVPTFLFWHLQIFVTISSGNCNWNVLLLYCEIGSNIFVFINILYQNNSPKVLPLGLYFVQFELFIFLQPFFYLCLIKRMKASNNKIKATISAVIVIVFWRI